MFFSRYVCSIGKKKVKIFIVTRWNLHRRFSDARRRKIVICRQRSQSVPPRGTTTQILNYLTWTGLTVAVNRPNKPNSSEGHSMWARLRKCLIWNVINVPKANTLELNKQKNICLFLSDQKGSLLVISFYLIHRNDHF
jgi:hypothetical protein